MLLREYNIEDGNEVDLNGLKSNRMSLPDYILSHRSLPMPCHDAFIRYQGGILLVTRDNPPHKNELWPFGGRIERGMKTEDSLKTVIKRESGLELEDIALIGCIRIFAGTDPFGHGKGTDCPAFVYSATGKGDLKLDSLHRNPRIITHNAYPKIRSSLHPYVRDFMDLLI